MSEEIEGRVTKKLSEELIRIESQILGALSMLDELLVNPQVWVKSRKSDGENQETNEDLSQ